METATPYRKDFYTKLGEDQAKVADAMAKEVAALEKVWWGLRVLP
jgi:hypothetical protein